ncbi:MAG: response regulator [Chloroflexota bacterium]|nr:response regulator [Chloroflexota bacterium]
MDTYRILIVDDQREVRRVLRSAIETLDSNFKVIDVPSGEEALLEISVETFDLLISDVRLPGISGLELLEKLRGRNPDMGVILVTGVMDTQVRRDVADAGADAFFLKPIESADLLDAVERCLGLIDAPSIVKTPFVIDKPTENVSEHLANLRKELNAISAVFLDERGRVVARAGDLPDASVETALFPALMSAFSAGEKIAHLLHVSPPSDLMYFSGVKYDIFLAHVGESYAFLVALNPISSSDQVEASVRIVHAGIQELLAILTNMGVPLKTDEQPPFIEDDSLEAAPEEMAADAPLIESLFQKSASSDIKQEEIDAFWDAASVTTDGDITNADALSYEQARQLGLAPDEG